MRRCTFSMMGMIDVISYAMFFSCTVLKCREFLFPLFLPKKTPIGNICPGEKKKQLAQVSTGEAITSFPGRVQVGTVVDLTA